MLERHGSACLQSLCLSKAGRSGRTACGKSGGELRECGPALPKTEIPERGWQAGPETAKLRENGIFKRLLSVLLGTSVRKTLKEL